MNDWGDVVNALMRETKGGGAWRNAASVTSAHVDGSKAGILRPPETGGEGGGEEFGSGGAFAVAGVCVLAEGSCIGWIGEREGSGARANGDAERGGATWVLSGGLITGVTEMSRCNRGGVTSSLQGQAQRKTISMVDDSGGACESRGLNKVEKG